MYLADEVSKGSAAGHIIVNYPIPQRGVFSTNWSVAALDEGHYARRDGDLQDSFDAVLTLARTKIILTATPLMQSHNVRQSYNQGNAMYSLPMM